MNTARYVVAFITLVTYPPAVAYWFMVHPFVGFWRRLGKVRAYLILVPLMLAMAAGIAVVADELLAVDYGTNVLLWPFAVAAFVVGASIEKQCRKLLSFPILAGVPELSPPGERGELLADGIYGRVRHPRYLAVLFNTLGLALFANFLAVYALIPLLVLGLYVVVVFEERELRDRFGEVYADYARRVPRFVPRLD